MMKITNWVLAAGTEDLPSAGPVLSWFQGEGGNIVLIALIFTLGFFAFKKDLTKGIIAVISIALFYVFLKNPQGTVIAWMQALTDLISGN
ncbi:hypothetical protein GCM10025886_14150 [Tetragenococcus halophilus subsp. flandriensis]|uniref:hypothetical protein n=1 Tax=Tetragenococcus halophilus TaxID=51669 RepID=UPI0023E91CAE|nr:hypothetical protein [Tetragenococcus halophilus]GMA08264.1 hypothetical protein GCM10025886_14150 [Tetragenococcus halophilus subsp. flandriensis]